MTDECSGLNEAIDEAIAIRGIANRMLGRPGETSRIDAAHCASLAACLKQNGPKWIPYRQGWRLARLDGDEISLLWVPPAADNT